MKRRGIGRPSSYASIVKNIIDKGQVQMKGRSLIPGELGEATIALLEHNFSFLSLDFTRNPRSPWTGSPTARTPT